MSNLRSSFLPALALGLVGLACQAAPLQPTPMYRGQAITVAAHDDATAHAIGREVEELLPLIRAALPGTSIGHVHVDVQCIARGTDVHAVTTRFRGGYGRIEVKALADPALDRYVLAHELVHCAMGADWKALPGALEEGLAEMVALELSATARVRIAPKHEATLAASQADGAASIEWLRTALSLSLDGVYRESEQAKALLYACGMQIVQRIGVEKLHALCVDAGEMGRTRVHFAQLLAAAGAPGFDPTRPHEVPQKLIAVEFGELKVGAEPLLPATFGAPALPARVLLDSAERED